MGDWSTDPPVLSAIHDFDEAQARWRQVSPSNGILPSSASHEQRIAYARMRAADRAYVSARDQAIHRVRLNFTHDQPQLRWPAERRVSLSKSRRRASDLLSPV